MQARPELYPLVPFRFSDRAALLALIAEYPLATLFCANELSLIPLIAREAGDELRLWGHVDANNPQAAALRVGDELSFMFQGPNAYGSPDLYPDPQLPGWLYVAVKGKAVVVEESSQADSRRSLIEATQQFGASDQRFVLEPDDKRIDAFIGAISAFDLRVTEISGIAKLAQDKGEPSARLAAKHLASVQSDHGPLFERLLALTLE